MPRGPIRRPLALALWLAATFASPPLAAQEKAISIDQAIASPQLFFATGLPGLRWHPDGRHLTWVARSEGGVALVKEPALAAEDGSAARTVVVTVEALAAAAAAAGIEPIAPPLLAEASWEADGRSLRIFDGRALLRVTLEPLKVERRLLLPEGIAASRFSPDDRQVAYVEDHDVRVIKADGSRVEVTAGGHEDLTHGVSVSREEFGITEGLFWDPTGRRLAFYREDKRPIAPYPYVDYGPRPARAAAGRYPMAGLRGSVVGVGVYDSRSDAVAWLEVDPALDQYLTNVTWNPAGTKVYVARVNRDQDRMDLNVYDAATGKDLGVILTETDPQWIEPEEGPVFLPDGSGSFLWRSPRDGYHRYYLHDAQGRLVRAVTEGAFDVVSFEGFSADGRRFRFRGAGPDPRHVHLFEAGLDGAQRALTTGRGVHEVAVAPGGRLVLDQWTHAELPLRVQVLGEDGAVRRRVHEAPPPLAGYRAPKHELFSVTTAEGHAIHGDLFLPPDSEPGRRHPVIHYVYGGPHLQLVQDAWLGGKSRWNAWIAFMASRGYIVVRADNRGTPHRGMEWEQCVHRRLGDLEVRDQAAVLEHVLRRPDADPARVGVHGWSYGGYLTLCLMTKEGGRYKAGVAGGPVTGWEYYETGYGERYMDTPEQNPEGYRNAAPGNFLEGLQGRLLVVHGGADDVVVLQHTMAFVARCVEAGKDVDYMIYPGEKHGLAGPSFAHFLRKMTRFFDEALGGP